MDSKIVETAVKVASSVDNKHAEQVKSPTEPAVRKSMKEEKSRKKDDKSVEQVLKALNSLETTEEKLAAMCKKYSDIVDENRKLQLTMKQAEKRFSMVQREKEQLQTEHSKAVLTRSRLESLCRELQRQNKAIKDESLLKIREEEEKRKEVSAKFQSTLNEITALMQQNNEKNSKLREDNLEMTKKFKTVCEQYELREQQVEKISKQMQLETQLADAKLAKARMEFVAEKEILLKEKQHLLTDLSEYKAKYQELQQTEVNLRSQISLYTDKYDEFQNALSRSNEVFGGFKGEMEKMSKKICKLEKETSSWKQRWEKSHQALLEMAADKQQRDSELALANRQLAQLQKLCRTLQAERTSLLAQLRTEGANRVTETAGKEDIPLGTLQSLHDAMPCPLNSSNLELCGEEAEKKVISTENSPDTNKLLSDLIRNVSALQVNPEQNSTGETPPVLEAIVEPVGTITNEQTVCSQTEQTMPMQNQDNLIEAPAPESPKVESGYSTAVSSEIQADQNSSLSNDHISTKEACPGSLINGQIPLHEFSDRSVKIEEISPEAKSIESVNSSHNTPNGIIEPVAEKTSPTETKKGKDGGKKRKNK